MKWSDFKKHLEFNGVTNETIIGDFDIVGCPDVKNLQIVIREGVLGRYVSVNG